MNELWQVIGLALTSGALASFLTFFISKKRETRTDFEAIIKTWSQDNIRLRESEVAAVSRLTQLEIEVNNLRNKIILLEAANHEIPIPMWLKDEKGVLLAVNNAYEDMILTPNMITTDYAIGKVDEELWGTDLAKQYRKNDFKVYHTEKSFCGREKMKIGDTYQDWHVMKYVRYAGKIKLGISGIGYPINNKT